MGLLVVALCGCVAIKTEGEVYGSYELTSHEVRVILQVAADRSYSETIRFSDGSGQRNSGRWRWADGRVCFTALLVPKSLLSDLFKSAHREDWPKVVGNSYQLDYCIPAGKEYGRTILEINPDGPDNFRKVKSATAR